MLLILGQEHIMQDYGRRLVLDIPFELAVAETSHVLREEGLEIVSPLDVRAYLPRSLHHERRRYILLDAQQYDPGLRPSPPVTVAIFELADGETAVVAVPPLAPVRLDFARQAASPALSTIGELKNEQLAQALERLQRTARHCPALVQS